MVIDVNGAICIERLIARFANSFDLKEWETLGSCLASTVHTDYSDLRGTPPETMSRERFVELRRVALQSLRTHHLSGNIEIQLHGTTGVAKASMVIYRRSPEEEILNTHCLYTFGVEKKNGHWAICSIVQRVFWSDGQKAIHRGIEKA
jgi:hypothetical protein